MAVDYDKSMRPNLYELMQGGGGGGGSYTAKKPLQISDDEIELLYNSTGLEVTPAGELLVSRANKNAATGIYKPGIIYAGSGVDAKTGTLKIAEHLPFNSYGNLLQICFNYIRQIILGNNSGIVPWMSVDSLLESTFRSSANRIISEFIPNLEPIEPRSKISIMSDAPTPNGFLNIYGPDFNLTIVVKNDTNVYVFKAVFHYGETVTNSEFLSIVGGSIIDGGSSDVFPADPTTLGLVVPIYGFYYQGAGVINTYMPFEFVDGETWPANFAEVVHLYCEAVAAQGETTYGGVRCPVFPAKIQAPLDEYFCNDSNDLLAELSSTIETPFQPDACVKIELLSAGYPQPYNDHINVLITVQDNLDVYLIPCLVVNGAVEACECIRVGYPHIPVASTTQPGIVQVGNGLHMSGQSLVSDMSEPIIEQLATVSPWVVAGTGDLTRLEATRRGPLVSLYGCIQIPESGAISSASPFCILPEDMRPTRTVSWQQTSQQTITINNERFVPYFTVVVNTAGECKIEKFTIDAKQVDSHGALANKKIYVNGLFMIGA